MAHKQFTREDIEDIKRYAAGGMSLREIAYVMECSHVAIHDVLNKTRQRYKDEKGIKRKLFAGLTPPEHGGNTLTICTTDDTEEVHYEKQRLPEDYDPTLEMAALLERMERKED